MDAQLKNNAPHLVSYAKLIAQIYPNPELARQEQQAIKTLYHVITAESLILPPAAKTVNAR